MLWWQETLGWQTHKPRTTKDCWQWPELGEGHETGASHCVQRKSIPLTPWFQIPNLKFVALCYSSPKKLILFPLEYSKYINYICLVYLDKESDIKLSNYESLTDVTWVFTRIWFTHLFWETLALIGSALVPLDWMFEEKFGAVGKISSYQTDGTVRT